MLLGEIEDDEKVGDLSLPPIQSNCPGLKEDPGDQGDLGDPEDHDDHEYLGDPGDPEDHGDPGDHEDHEMQHDSWTEGRGSRPKKLKFLADMSAMKM